MALDEQERSTGTRYVSTWVFNGLPRNTNSTDSPPGPMKRWMVNAYCERNHRKIEFVPISKDTTEADLKQRREIVNANVVFKDQPPVTAALEGKILVLDGSVCSIFVAMGIYTCVRTGKGREERDADVE